jgi:hypothetical protein
MSMISAEKFCQICDDVWRDRAAILSRRGLMSAEDALVRAVYWRVRKAGGEPAHSLDSYSPLLDKLVRRCRDEAAQSC